MKHISVLAKILVEMVLPAHIFARILYLAFITRIGPGGKIMFFHPRRVCYYSCISLHILHSPQSMQS